MTERGRCLNAKLIASTLSRHGALLCRYPEPHAEYLLALEPAFGSPIAHELSSNGAIYDIRDDGDCRLHYGRSSLSQEPHTDSPFREDPPAVVALQCVHPSPIGGVSILVFGERVHGHLQQTCSAVLDALYEANSILASRGKFARHTQVFTKRTGGRVQIAYRRDSAATMQGAPLVEQGLSLIELFTRDPKNQTHLVLRPGDILVLDNHRILHGRTSFPKGAGRLLRRVWFDGRVDELELGFNVPSEQMLSPDELPVLTIG